MSEVEKLYKNAEVELDCCKYAEYGYEGEEGSWYYCKKEGRECWTYPHGDADCVEKGYPSFTPKKQLTLIEWLIQNKRLCIHKAEYSDNFYMDTATTRLNGVDNSSFEECLASMLNLIWQDCTEAEQEQIRRILNE